MEWSDRIRKAFFTLVRAGLWNREPADCACFPLTISEWKTVWGHAVRQSVRGIVFDGICLLPEECMPDVQLLVLWTAEIERIEQRNRKMNRVLLSMVQCLKEREVNPLVLKGQGVAQFYERPLLRECGDVDLYFANRQDEQVLLDWVQSQGVVVRNEPDGTHAYVLEGIEVEHHHRIFDLYSSGIQKYLLDLTRHEGFSSQSIDTDTDSCICVLSPILNFISLNAHILKHLMGHGIGLRQFCDMARAYHVLQLDYEGEALKACYQRCGLARWSRLLHTLLVRDLGLPREELPYQEELYVSADTLLDRVMAEGNFGKYTAARTAGSQSVWNRKLHTGLAFLGNLRFSLRYAPREAVGLVSDLFFGNLKS